MSAWGEILIAVADRCGHVDPFDQQLTSYRAVESGHELEPTLGSAGSHVEEPAQFRLLAEPEHDVHAVPHVDEIPLLAAVGIVGSVGPEQARGPTLGGAWIRLADHATHLAFVVLIWSVDVEELEPYPLRWHRVGHWAAPRDPTIEGVLAPSVRVPRLQALQRRRVGPVAEPL